MILNVWKWNVTLPGSYTCYFTVNASDEVGWVRGGRPQSKAFQEKQSAGTNLTATGLLKVSLTLCEGRVSHQHIQDAPDSV